MALRWKDWETDYISFRLGKLLSDYEHARADLISEIIRRAVLRRFPQTAVFLPSVPAISFWEYPDGKPLQYNTTSQSENSIIIKRANQRTLFNPRVHSPHGLGDCLAPCSKKFSFTGDEDKQATTSYEKKENLLNFPSSRSCCDSLVLFFSSQAKHT